MIPWEDNKTHEETEMAGLIKYVEYSKPNKNYQINWMIYIYLLLPIPITLAINQNFPPHASSDTIFI